VNKPVPAQAAKAAIYTGSDCDRVAITANTAVATAKLGATQPRRRAGIAGATIPPVVSIKPSYRPEHR
jgi:hypothetical protein